jgi:hypothetical protein
MQSGLREERGKAERYLLTSTSRVGEEENSERHDHAREGEEDLRGGKCEKRVIALWYTRQMYVQRFNTFANSNRGNYAKKREAVRSHLPLPQGPANPPDNRSGANATRMKLKDIKSVSAVPRSSVSSF